MLKPSRFVFNPFLLHASSSNLSNGGLQWSLCKHVRKISGEIYPFLPLNTVFLCTKQKLKMTEIAQEPNSHEGKTNSQGDVAGTMAKSWWLLPQSFLHFSDAAFRCIDSTRGIWHGSPMFRSFSFLSFLHTIRLQKSFLQSYTQAFRLNLHTMFNTSKSPSIIEEIGVLIPKISTLCLQNKSQT